MRKVQLSLTLATGLFISASTQADFIDLAEQFDSEVAKRVAVSLNSRYIELQEFGCQIPGFEGQDSIESINLGSGNFDEFIGDDSGSGLILPDSALALEDGNNISAGLPQTPFLEGCSGRSQLVFNNIDRLIQTGNALTESQQPSFNGLGLTVQELNDALVFLAAEEYAAQGDISRDFTTAQSRSLSARLSDLRSGSKGFSLGYNQPGQQVHTLAQSEQARMGHSGAGAGSDTVYSPWGGFINLQYSNGSRDNSSLENAFDSSGYNVNAGFDYRIDNNWVTGVSVGYTNKKAEFDPNKSVVDGSIDSDGLSLMPFIMYQNDKFFSSLSVGTQRINFEASRAVRFADVDTRSEGRTDGTINSYFAEIGYTFTKGKYSFEPYLNVNGSDVSIDAFVERDINNTGYNLTVNEQNFDLLDVTFGLSTQAVFSANNKVFAPYFTVELVSQRENEGRAINSNLFSSSPFADSAFQLESEELDSTYSTFTLGVSGVLRGSSQKQDGGSTAGEVQGYAEIKTISGYTNYSLSIYSFGLRMSF